MKEKQIERSRLKKLGKNIIRTQRARYLRKSMIGMNTARWDRMALISGMKIWDKSYHLKEDRRYLQIGRMKLFQCVKIKTQQIFQGQLNQGQSR